MKDDTLRKAVQGCKLINLRYDITNIALIAGISRSTANNKIKDIDSYWNEPSITPDEDKNFLLTRSIDIGLSKVSKLKEQTSEDTFGIILGTYLKVETNLLDEADSLIRAWTIGQHITNIYGNICSYKKKGYTHIHSVKDTHAKYLLDSRNMNQSSLNKLFTRTKSYLVDQYTKKWSSTDLLRMYVEVSINRFLSINSNSNILEFSSHMFSEKCTTQAISQASTNNNIADKTKGYFFKINYNYVYTMLRAKISTIEQFEPSSKFSLLTQAVSISNDEIHVHIKHKAKGSEYLGRTYNVFCSLRSQERLKLGYISYDMSAAMQSICLHLVKAKKEEYPELWAYAHDKEHKRKMRKEVANALGIEDDDVKKKLTAFANGSMAGIKKHHYYTVFQEESARLRRAVLAHVELYEHDVLKRANEQSRKLKEYPDELDWLDTESKETSKEARVKSSVFFFVWTWYERQIRQAMLDILEDGIEVHDAVYSQMDIPVHHIQNNILQQTGFDIIIEKEMPLKFIE